jgi:hypothetical protein
MPYKWRDQLDGSDLRRERAAMHARTAVGIVALSSVVILLLALTWLEQLSQ